MLPLRVWVHCPRASNGLLPPRSYLVGYLRWHAGSDGGFFPFSFFPPSDNHSNSFQVARRQTFPYKTREELPVIRAESYAIASRLCARPPNHNFRCVFQKSLRSFFPTGDHGRHFFWLKAAAGEECEQIGQVGTRIGNSEEQSRGVEIHLRERK